MTEGKIWIICIYGRLQNGHKFMILYFLIINLIGIGAMVLDKYKAEKDKWRVPEMTLFMITFLGGRNWYNFCNV